MTTFKKSTLSFVSGVSLLLVFAVPVMAQTITPIRSRAFGTSTPRMRNASTSVVTIQKEITRSDTEIDSRITALNNLLTRIQSMKNVSVSDQSMLSSEIQTQIGDMTTLKAKVDADTDVATLRTDLASITKDYRIYALVIPQGQILAAADRLNTIAADLSAVGTKLQTRITSDQTAGQDMTAAQASLNDLETKVSDAETQAQTATNSVAALVPDQGDTTTAAANTAALKTARAALKTGQADVQAARQDAGSILKAIGISKAGVSVTSSSTAVGE